MRVQILSSRVGGGHLSVARALVEGLRALGDPDLEVWVDDLYVDLARLPARRFPWIYALATRRLPWLWRAFYRATDLPPNRRPLTLLEEAVGGPGLRRILDERRPNAVVSVLPGIADFTARSLESAGVSATIEVVVTDWADIHMGWASRRATHYSVPTESAAATLGRAGVPAEKVTVAGFPVREQFIGLRRNEATCRAARERLDLPPDRFVVLAMVGTEGSPAALAHLRALAMAPIDAEILVVCGRNARLRRRVSQLDSVNTLRALGFIDDVAGLMLASNLLVTKAGGVTLAEAFCCGIPVVAFDPLPGQEEGNARFVVAEEAAELATSPRDLAQIVGELRWSPTRRASLQANGARLATPGAALRVAAAILRRARADAMTTR
ncbi:MAG: glycosyltransferase [Chloroflexota bacterium]|nr:glycosyltransferase [Chloroflexota bacterium]